MTPLVQVCIVVATIALVALTLMTMRLVKRLSTLTESIGITLRHSEDTLVQSKASWDRLEVVLKEVEAIAQAIHGGTARLTSVVDRTTDMASDLLDEVQRPVQRVVALMRGVRAATNALAQRSNGRQRALMAKNAGGHNE